tara:strand:- start:4342 stop:4572 length:231 start_codon:yes stop_codon:yes gene_type:complete
MFMWPFTTQNERQAEAMSQILAENAYERKMERVAGWVRTVVALFSGIAITFAILIGMEVLGLTPVEIWNWLKSIGK